MNDHEDIQCVREILEGTGLAVERVPTAAARRCDLRAVDATATYLIEVKGFHDSQEMNAVLATGGVFTSARRTQHLGAVNSAMKDAVVQLDGSALPGENAFRLVVLLALTSAAPTVTESQIRGTLYGMRIVYGVRKTGENLCANCLYFAHSGFAGFSSVDAALIVHANGDFALFVNDFGPNKMTFMKSGLAKWFAARGALNDAHSLEHAGGHLVADFDHDRSDSDTIRRLLMDKYQLRTAVVLHFTEHSAAIRIPRVCLTDAEA
jgi:hypothetical protein